MAGPQKPDGLEARSQCCRDTLLWDRGCFAFSIAHKCVYIHLGYWLIGLPPSWSHSGSGWRTEAPDLAAPTSHASTVRAPHAVSPPKKPREGSFGRLVAISSSGASSDPRCAATVRKYRLWQLGGMLADGNRRDLGRPPVQAGKKSAVAGVPKPRGIAHGSTGPKQNCKYSL